MIDSWWLVLVGVLGCGVLELRQLTKALGKIERSLTSGLYPLTAEENRKRELQNEIDYHQARSRR
jgi:hypothetical protein